MAGPSDQWLRSGGFPVLTAQGLQQPAPPGGPVPINLGQPMGGAPPPMLTLPGAPAPVSDAPPVTTIAPPGTPMTAPPPSPPAAPQGTTPTPPIVEARQVGGGGMTPAREAPTRGPKANALLEHSFQAPADAATRSNERVQEQVVDSRLLYQQEAEAAQHRAEAMEAAAQKRSDELRVAAADYNSSVDRAASMKIDSNRWWGNKSTGEQIGTTLLAAIGGLFGGQSGGIVGKTISDQIDADVAAQKFDYESGLARAKGKETVYKMMLERYQSEDAAMAATRAAALQATAMRIDGMKEQWKGVDAASRADEIKGSLMRERDTTMANGLKYVPAAKAEKQYMLNVGGQALPVPVPASKVNQIVLEHGVKPVEKASQTKVEGDVQLQVAQGKAQADQQKDARQEMVVLPNGDTVRARNPAEAQKLSDQSSLVGKTQALVNEAKQIRAEGTWRTSPTARARLGQIQADLTVGYKEQAQLGALSADDYKLAMDGTANLFDIGSRVEAQLDAIGQRSVRDLQRRVATIPGTPDTAQGKPPASFKLEGK